MKQPAILVVEDNAITRKVFRIALAREGYSVFEAPDGETALDLIVKEAPDLILQDLLLPDMDGMELLLRTRALRQGAEVPIIAVSGFLTQRESYRISSAGFNDLLAKPVEPSRLVERVRAFLSPPDAPTESVSENLGQGRRVLVADDDPVQLRLLGVRLERMGFRVTSASNGEEALRQARSSPPDAIVSDVLMPGPDGFELCLALRRDPGLARVPVVLVSANYFEPEDVELGRKVGASACIFRTPDLEDVIRALLASLGKIPAPLRLESLEELKTEHSYRVVRQLEGQVAMNSTLFQHCALLASVLSMMAAFSEALTRPLEVGGALGEALTTLLDAGGISMGAVYLLGPDGRLSLEVQNGCRNLVKGELESCFGQLELLQQVLERGTLETIPSATLPEQTCRDVLARAGVRSAVLAPLIPRGDPIGVLLLASNGRDLTEKDWLSFAQSVALQMGQALALNRTFSQLTASEHRYRGLFEAARDATLVSDQDERIVDANFAAFALSGYTPEEMRALGWTDLLSPGTPEAFPGTESRTEEKSPFLREYSLLCKDGTRRSVEVSVSGITPELSLQVLRDITERRQLEEQLRQSQKMEAVGRLAGGIAHDFNNLLTVIKGYSELLVEEVSGDGRLRRAAEEINKAADRAAALTRQLLAFGRRQVLEPKVLDLNDVVANLEKMLRRLIGEDIDLVSVRRPGLGRVKADPGQIEQVIMNLAVNARDAMPQGGKLTIETANVELDEAYARNHVAVQPGPYVMLAVSDTGCGMDAETQARLFEPFFTTKELGKGTGLGLATVYGIVKQSGGNIWVYSEPGRGATLKVYLPQVEGTAEGEEAGPTLAAPARGSETVLLVEDEESVRKLVRETLQKNGYTVLEARDGADAIQLCERYPSPIHLLLTDVVMPGMSGRALAERLAPLCPNTRVLYMSGYTDNAIVHHGVLDAGAAFLQKPFTAADLARKVRQVLDAAGVP